MLGTPGRFPMYQSIKPMRTWTVVLALTATIAGCDGGERPGGDKGADPSDGIDRVGEPSNGAQRPAGGQHPISVSPTGEGCPGTRPSRTPPFPGEDFNYGNGYLGAALWPRGRLVASRGGATWAQILPDGSIWAKVAWWRAVPGRLTIHGERLDGPAPPLRASVPMGYGSTGFQSTGLTFPTAGCWRVAGRVAAHELEFVVFVTKRGAA
jgi:hypothetical protein